LNAIPIIFGIGVVTSVFGLTVEMIYRGAYELKSVIN
jgi:hypothetical protein